MEALLIILPIQHLKLFTSTCEIIYQKFLIISNLSILASKTKSDVVNLAFLLSSNIKLEMLPKENSQIGWVKNLKWRRELRQEQALWQFTCLLIIWKLGSYYHQSHLWSSWPPRCLRCLSCYWSYLPLCFGTFRHCPFSALIWAFSSFN